MLASLFDVTPYGVTPVILKIERPLVHPDISDVYWTHTDNYNFDFKYINDPGK